MSWITRRSTRSPTRRPKSCSPCAGTRWRTWGNLGDLPGRLKQLGEEKAAQECGIGVPTLRDIVSELQKPGRDPRDQLPPPPAAHRRDGAFRPEAGDEAVPAPCGTWWTLALLWISASIRMGWCTCPRSPNRYIRHPSEVLSVGGCGRGDGALGGRGKKRISLTMRGEK